MPLSLENLFLIGSVLLLLSILASKTTGRLGVPALVVFLGIGMLAGSDGIGGIYFDDPALTQSLGVIALTFILFSGGLETRWESVKPVLRQGLVLSTLGVLLTAGLVGLFVAQVTEFSLTEGLLIGAIVSSTDAAAVFSVLRSRNTGLKGNLRPLLELESGSNDPMAWFLTIGITGLLVHPESSFINLIPLFFRQMVVGAVVGVLMGRGMAWLLNRIKLDFDGLYPVLVLAMVLFTYGGSTYLQGNGFLAVYLAGMVLGNRNFIHKNSIIRFYDGQAWIMQIVMFLALGLLVFPKQMIPFAGTGLLIALFLMFAARPVAVFLCLIPFKMNHRERTLVSWVGLRGAVPIVFATYPLLQGVDKSGMIFHIVFFIVLTSVILQGTTISMVARWLYLYKPVRFRKRYPLELEISDTFRNELFEVVVEPGSPVVRKQLLDLNLPGSSLVVLISRGQGYITPKGTTVLEEGDRLLVMSDNKRDEEAVRKIACRAERPVEE